MDDWLNLWYGVIIYWTGSIVEQHQVFYPNSVSYFCPRDGSSAQVTYTLQESEPYTKGQHEAVVTVTEGGHILSGVDSGLASLLVTAHEEFGVNQSVVVLVKVSENRPVLEWAVSGQQYY